MKLFFTYKSIRMTSKYIFQVIYLFPQFCVIFSFFLSLLFVISYNSSAPGPFKRRSNVPYCLQTRDTLPPSRGSILPVPAAVRRAAGPRESVGAVALGRRPRLRPAPGGRRSEPHPTRTREGGLLAGRSARSRPCVLGEHLNELLGKTEDQSR